MFDHQTMVLDNAWIILRKTCSASLCMYLMQNFIHSQWFHKKIATTIY